MILLLTAMLWIAGQTPADLIRCSEADAVARGESSQSKGAYCGSIEGVVVRAGSNIGIPNAFVTLKVRGELPDCEGLRTVTDSNGRFSFPLINPGEYIICVVADGYVPAEFGQPPGEKINVGRGQRKVLYFGLNPYPTAFGVVRTTDSQPIAAALMRAYRITYTPIGRRLKIAGTALSTDLGDYHLLEMEPGDYYVSASLSERARAIPVPGTLLTANLSNPDAGLATTFYPAAPSASVANAFTLTPSADRGGLMVTMKESARFTIHVHVLSPSNKALPAFSVALLPAGAEIGDAPDYAVKRNGGADFDIRYVEAGHYSLIAFDKGRILSEAVPINADHDQEVKIPVTEPLDIPGVIVDEFGKPVSGKMQVRLVRREPELGQTFQADVDSGNFVMLDVGPGVYDVYVDKMPVGSYIKEVQFPSDERRYGKIRIDSDKLRRLVDPITQRLRSEPAIQVVLTASSATVDGFVWTGKRLPNENLASTIFLVPDRQASNSNADREDHFIIGSSDAGGHFEVKGVPFGSYNVFGFEAIAPGLYFDSQFIDSISDLGVRVIIKGIPGESFHMSACSVPFPPPDSLCLLRIPRAKSLGVSP